MIASGVERAHPRLRDDDIRARVGRHAHGQTATPASHPTSLGSRLTSLRHAAAPGPTPPATTGIVTAGRYGRALAPVHRRPKGTRWRVSPDSRVERLAPLHRTAGTVAGSATVLTFPELLQSRASCAASAVEPRREPRTCGRRVRDEVSTPSRLRRDELADTRLWRDAGGHQLVDFFANRPPERGRERVPRQPQRDAIRQQIA